MRSRFLGVPAATEVVPGWYLGGLFVDRVRLPDGGDDQAQDPDGKGPTWAAIVDLTCEFAERGRCHPEDYYHLPTWDGCPPDHTRFAEVRAVAAATTDGDESREGETEKVPVVWWLGFVWPNDV